MNADQWRDFVNIVDDITLVGDINGDGTMDITDVSNSINAMLNLTAPTEAHDVTGDGHVDVADINAVINIMLGK